MSTEQWSFIFQSICILAAWSYLVKGENPVYTGAEHFLVGSATAYGIVYTWQNQLVPRVVDDIIGKGKWGYLIPAALGLLIYFAFIKGHEWIARITMGFWIGYGAGYALAYNPPVFLKQVFDSFINLNTGKASTSINNILYFLVVVTALVYFAFTLKKDRGVAGGASKFGRYALMVAFGSAYGSITMAYLSLIIGQLNIIFRDTLHLVK
ncbi:MAG: hypothetical protein ACM3WU_08820 [Bacillota bacterium]